MQKSDLGHFLAQTPFCERRHLIAAYGAGGLRPAVGKFKGFGAVNGRLCVWPSDQSAHPASGSGQASGAKAFLMPLARLADLCANVDNAWRKIFALAVTARQGRIIGGNAAVFDAQIAQLDGLSLWVNQVNICNAQ